MLQASCIYLGLITHCPETYHPLHSPRRLITPLPICQSHLNKRILKTSRLIDVSLIASTNLPISMKPPWSLLALSLVVRPTVAPPCLNKGNLLLLRLSFLFCLARTMPYRYIGKKALRRWRQRSKGCCQKLRNTRSVSGECFSPEAEKGKEGSSLESLEGL